MKKFRFALASLVIAGLTLSCEDDDNTSSASIEGKWTPTKTITIVDGDQSVVNYQGNQAGCDKDYREFAGSGVYRYVVLYLNTSDACTEDIVTSSWTKSGDMLTIVDTNPATEVSPPDAGVYEITKLTNNELRLTSTATAGSVEVEVTEVYTRL